MADIYGYKWTKQYGTADDLGTWERGLTGLMGQQIANGLTGCALRDDPWPPSLPEFRKMCEGGGEDYDKTDGAAVAARIPHARRLPEPPEMREARRAVGNAALNEIYAKMGWKRPSLEGGDDGS